MLRSQRLLKEAAEAVKRAKAIAAKADGENRELTSDEASEFTAKMNEARSKKADSDTAKADEAVMDEATKWAVDLDLDEQREEKDDKGKGGHKSLGELFTKSGEYDTLMKSVGAGRDEFGNPRIPEKVRIQSAPVGLKSLFTGTSGTSGGAFVVPDQSGIFETLGRRPLMIRDVISVRRTTSDTIEYVVQTAHTNNAAPVPEALSADPIGTGTGFVTPVVGGLKPQGSWAFLRKTTSVVTIAEWVPATKRALADAAQLEGIINDELRADIGEAEEDQIVNGDGSGENLTGILNVSGTQPQDFETDVFVTVRKALTKARIGGRVVPNGIGMNPEDVETVDLAREDGATGRFLGAGPFALGPRTLWGIPIVETEAIPAGTAVVGDWTKAVLWDREQASITASDSHADFFTRNLVAVLGEERVAFGVVRPSGLVVAALR